MIQLQYFTVFFEMLRNVSVLLNYMFYKTFQKILQLCTYPAEILTFMIKYNPIFSPPMF